MLEWSVPPIPPVRASALCGAIEQQPWRGGLEPYGEHDYTLSPSNPAHVIGTIPEALQGTLYRCGPGRIRVCRGEGLEPCGEHDYTLLSHRKCHISLPSLTLLSPTSQAIEQQPWRGGLEPCGEHDYTLSPSNPAHITGRIPEALQGTLYRCGPGRIRVGGTKFGHWFDGDGMVYALHLDGPNGTARFVCKWVRTSALEQRGGPELEAGEGKGEDTGIRVKGAWTQATAGGLLKNVGLPANPVNTRGSREGKGKSTGIRVKGAWTQATGGGPLKNVGLPANPVNTSITHFAGKLLALCHHPLHFAGKLLALCEGGPPFLLNPLLLSLSPAYLSSHPPTSIIHFAGKLLALCEGGPPFLLDAQSLSTVGPYSFPNLALPFFSAHPKLDPATGVEVSGKQASKQLDLEGGRLSFPDLPFFSAHPNPHLSPTIPPDLPASALPPPSPQPQLYSVPTPQFPLSRTSLHQS
ncbi:unnamed protein product, partial [Closterium sp. NIES-65]